jgi:hypothetical protein
MSALPSYVLLNIAHTGRCPRHDRAAFRVLGFFGSKADLEAHVRENQTDVDAFAAPTEKWIALSTSRAVDEAALLARLGVDHQARIKSHADEFERNVQERRTGVASHRDEQLPDSAGGAAGEKEPEGASTRPVGRDAEIRMQRFAIVSIINDASTSDVGAQQPAILLWGGAETENEARDRIRAELAPTVKDVTLDVVCMYEWIVVPTFKESALVDEEWREPKLNEIMAAKKSQSTLVRAYEEDCARQGLKPKIIEIENTAETDLVVTGHIPLDPPVVDEGNCVDGVCLAPAARASCGA